MPAQGKHLITYSLDMAIFIFLEPNYALLKMH